MKKNIIAFVFLITGFSLPLLSQTMPPTLKRQMLFDVLQLIFNYQEKCAPLSQDDINDFIQLFDNESCLIFNDLMGSSEESFLMVSDYAQYLQNGVYPGSISVEIKNIDHDEPVQTEEGKWMTKVSFQKKVEYFNNCNMHFKSEDYFDKYYNLTMTVFWYAQDKVCKIQDIDGDMPSSRPPLPADFVAIKKSDSRDSIILANGNPLMFNNEDVAFLPSDVTFDYPIDSDTRLEWETDSCKWITMKYKPLHWRFRPHVDWDVVTGSYRMSPISGVSASSHGTEFGFDFGYIHPTSKKVKTGFFFGIALAQDAMKEQMSSMNYYYGTYDSDYDHYSRHYEVKDMSLSASTMDLIVPLYLDFDWHWSKYFSVYTDLGLKTYINLKQEVTSLTGTYSVKGTYPQYNNLVIDQALLNRMGTSINGFVDNATLTLDNLEHKTLFLPMASVDGFGGLGVRFKFSDKKTPFLRDFYVDLGATWQYDLFAYIPNYSNKIWYISQPYYYSSLDYYRTTKKIDETKIKYKQYVYNNINTMAVVTNQNVDVAEKSAPVKYIDGKEVVRPWGAFMSYLTRSNTLKAKVSLIYRF